MDNTVKERVRLFLKCSKIKGVDFCNSIGVSAGFISGMRESIQPDKLKSIAIKYPTLSIGWLMTGEGEMLKGKDLNSNNNILGDGNFNLQGNIGGNSTFNNLSAKKIIHQDGTISGSNDNSTDKYINKESESMLKNEIIRLRERIHDMERTIQSQEKTILSLEKMVNMLENKVLDS